MLLQGVDGPSRHGKLWSMATWCAIDFLDIENTVINAEVDDTIFVTNVVDSTPKSHKGEVGRGRHYCARPFLQSGQKGLQGSRSAV